MKRVTLLAINAKYVHSSLAVWFLSGAVSRYSRFHHEVNIVEATINGRDDAIIEQITETEPDVLGISVYIWNARKLVSLLKEIRSRLQNTVIILGGPEASYNAEYWLSQGADYVIQGEGERGFPLLLDALADDRPDLLDTVPGLWRNKNGMPSHNPPEEPAGDTIDPYTGAYFTALNGRIAYLETSRGCPFQCSFCLSGGSSLRYFPLNAAKEQLRGLSRSGAKTIKLVDRTFNCNADRAYELFEYVIGMDTQCRFHFEVAADLFDERTLALLGKSPPGRIQLEAGLQSFYEPALEAVARRTSLKKAEQNIRTLLDGQNIHVHIDLIAGLPLETLQDFQESFNRAYALRAHTLQLGFLKLLHGSALREKAEQLGIIYNDEPPYEIIRSPWLSVDDLNTIRRAENALQHTYNSGRFLTTLQYVMSVTGLRPFSLYLELGTAAPNHGEQLDIYAKRLYEYFAGLHNVDADLLRDHIVCDWLRSVKGKNMPAFLREPSGRYKDVKAIAESFLGRKTERGEAAVLISGRHKGVFVDSGAPDPVTGLYKLHIVPK